jgi:hypothetical protein
MINDGAGARAWREAAGTVVLLALLLAAVPGAVRGQVSDTGRHRGAIPGQEAPGRLEGMVWGGVLTSGDLLRVEVPSGLTRQWLTPAGGSFNAYEFRVTLDEDAFLGFSLAYALREPWRLRLDVGWAELDATAEARTSQTVELHLYDQLRFFTIGLSVERPLVAEPSYPYLLAGAALTAVGADQATELDQTRLGIRLGAGYQHTFSGGWALRLEVADTIQQLDLEDHVPRLAGGEATDIPLEELGPQNLFEVKAGLSAGF